MLARDNHPVQQPSRREAVACGRPSRRLPTQPLPCGKHARPTPGRSGWPRRPSGTGFTLIELMIVVAIIGVLIAVLAPAASRAVTIARMVTCRSNLRDIYQSMLIYNNQHNSLPIAAGSEGLFAQAGAGRDLAPAANTPTPVSVTLWSIVKTCGVSSEMFVCPASGAKKDSAGPFDTDIYDFAGPENLSYAIQYPYGRQTYFNRESLSPSLMPMLADRGPLLGDGGDIEAMPSDSPESIRAWLADGTRAAKVNSANHGGAGQNVVWMDGHATWEATPCVGPREDNIYTIQTGDSPVGRMRGRAPAEGNKEPANNLDTCLVH